MTYSTNLQRRTTVKIDQLNRFDEAELEAALVALPGWPDMSAKDIRRAKEGAPAAMSYL